MKKIADLEKKRPDLRRDIGVAEQAYTRAQKSYDVSQKKLREISNTINLLQSEIASKTPQPSDKQRMEEALKVQQSDEMEEKAKSEGCKRALLKAEHDLGIAKQRLAQVEAGIAELRKPDNVVSMMQQAA